MARTAEKNFSNRQLLMSTVPSAQLPISVKKAWISPITASGDTIRWLFHWQARVNRFISSTVRAMHGNAPSHLDLAQWLDNSLDLVCPFFEKIWPRSDTDFVLTKILINGTNAANLYLAWILWHI